MVVIIKLPVLAASFICDEGGARFSTLNTMDESAVPSGLACRDRAATCGVKQ